MFLEMLNSILKVMENNKILKDNWNNFHVLLNLPSLYSQKVFYYFSPLIVVTFYIWNMYVNITIIMGQK